MKNTKIWLVVVLLAVCAAVAFAQKSPYDTADAATKNLLEQADALIAKGQYESAFKLVFSESNEYLIAKTTDICINYFAQSIAHQMFALKDLENGETLYDLRMGEGKYNMYMFDPVKIIADYQKSNGEKPILNYALGLYYESVFRGYSGRWLISDDEIIANTITYLQKAYDKNCYDGWSLSVLAEAYSRANDLSNAKKIFEKKVSAGYDLTSTDYFNFGAICYYTQDFQSAIKYLDKAILGYAGQPQYQTDAYLLFIKSCIESGDYKKAEKYIAECKSNLPQDYRIILSGVTLHAKQKNQNKLLNAAKELYAMAPENPSAPQMVLREYFDGGVEKWLPEFFDSCLKDYDSIGARQNLFYHYAYVLHEMGQTDKASVMAKNAKAEFQKNGALTEDIEKFLDSMIK